MKIQYLKPAPNATTGDIKDIATAQAVILIKLGFAKEYDENDSDNSNLFGKLDDNQNIDSEPPDDQEPSETEPAEPVADDQEPSETDEASEQEVSETAPAEPTTPTETTKPKKTKTKTDKN